MSGERKNIITVIAMLADDSGLTLFSPSGAVMRLSNQGVFDIERILEHNVPLIDGVSAVEIDLNDYFITKRIFEDEVNGIFVHQEVDGQTFEGTLYPTVTVQDGEDSVEIPNVKNLEKHAMRAHLEGSPAVTNFLKRLVPVIKERVHSVEDLMHFIARSELPLTDDGKIIAYKRVDRTHDDREVFVDCHSRRVEQNIGTRVTMDVDLVDSDRHNSCSVGLHVANLDYLRSFHGSHTLMVLVDPADFIAVPKGEDNKARVCSYDVVGVLSEENHEKAMSSEWIQGSRDFEWLISSILTGDIPAPTEFVKVGDREVLERWTAVPVEKVTDDPEAKPERSGKSLKSDKAPRKKNPVTVAKKAREHAHLTRKQRARELFEAGDWESLRAFAKKTQTGPNYWGLNDVEKALLLHYMPVKNTKRRWD